MDYYLCMGRCIDWRFFMNRDTRAEWQKEEYEKTIKEQENQGK